MRQEIGAPLGLLQQRLTYMRVRSSDPCHRVDEPSTDPRLFVSDCGPDADDDVAIAVQTKARHGVRRGRGARACAVVPELDSKCGEPRRNRGCWAFELE